MEENNYLLLIIDPQNDFCDPDGALYVPGAEEDMLRLSQFIQQNQDDISQIILTRDEHQVVDISHPAFWVNAEGDMPEPFTIISYQDVLDKKWFPVFMHDEVVDYLQALEQNNEMNHVVWPEHCLAGSWGAAFNDDVMDAVTDWARVGRFYTIVSKGQNPLTEHFGAIRANVELEEDPSTQINHRLVEELAMAPTIVLAGEARSHCVANTLKQIMEQPAIQGQIIVLTDCMSNVPGFENSADAIYQEAKARGVIFGSTDFFNGAEGH
ncbi:MAG: hypothetical protein ACWA6U_00205 [Breznakibacter sp.]